MAPTKDPVRKDVPPGIDVPRKQPEIDDPKQHEPTRRDPVPEVPRRHEQPEPRNDPPEPDAPTEMPQIEPAPDTHAPVARHSETVPL